MPIHFFAHRWHKCFGDTLPASFDCRQHLRERWLRIHNLPRSRRATGANADLAQVLERHNTAATFTLGQEARCTLFITRFGENTDWATDDPLPIGDAQPDHVLTAQDEGDTLQFFALPLIWRDGDHDAIITAITEGRTGPLLIANFERESLYAPYEGGPTSSCPAPSISPPPAPSSVAGSPRATTACKNHLASPAHHVAFTPRRHTRLRASGGPRAIHAPPGTRSRPGPPPFSRRSETPSQNAPCRSPTHLHQEIAMKTLILMGAAVLGLTLAAPATAEYVGPGIGAATPVTTVRDLRAGLGRERPVILRGNITGRVSNDLYRFRDATGTAYIDISARQWPAGQAVTDTTPIEIHGKYIPKVIGISKIEVLSVRVID